MPFGSVILDSDTHYGTEATTLGTKSPATRQINYFGMICTITYKTQFQCLSSDYFGRSV